MLKQSLRFSSFLVAASIFALAGTAEAKKKKKDPAAEEVKLDDEESKPKEEEKPPEEEKPAEEAAPAEESSGDADKDKKEEPSEGSSADAGDTSPVEQAGQSYYFVGARLRGLMIPSFIIGLFGEGGKTVLAPNFGPELIIRKDGFEWNLAATYTSYVMSHTPFKAPDDPQQAMELVDAHLKVLYLQGEALWSTAFSPKVAVQYGFGFGLGVVWGPLYREQAYPVGSGWEYCKKPPTPMSPGIQQEYCSPDPDLGSDPQHYAGYEEPSWTDSGSKPIIFPWLSLETRLRFKPTRHFAGHLDLGIGFGQVFFGLGGDYGI